MLPGAGYKYNSNKEIAGRLTLKYEPSTDFSATLRLFTTTQKDHGTSASTEIVKCGASGRQMVGARIDPFGDCKINGRVAMGSLPVKEGNSEPLFGNDGDPFGKFTSYLGSYTMDYSTGPLAFTAVTGYLKYKQRLSESPKTVFSPSNWTGYTDHSSQISQELRLVSSYEGPLNFTLGAYYEHNKLDTAGSSIVSAHAADPRTGSIATSTKLTTSRGDAYSAFGQLRWDIVETVELAGGVRYTRETKRGTAINSFINQNFALKSIYAPEGVLFRGKTSSSNYSPEVTLSWRPQRNTTVYAAYKTGYLSGGFGAPTLITANILTGNQLVYRPTTAKGGEVGVKTMLFDNSLRLTATAYRYNYKDLQLSNFRSSDFTQTINNVGAARTEGVELEALWRVAQPLTLHGAVAYSHARYKSFQLACYAGQTVALGCVAFQQELAGQALLRSPDWTGSAGFEYETELTSSLKIAFSADARYSSKYFTQANNNPRAMQQKYAQIDASIRLFDVDNRWRVAFIGRNLTDKSYSISSLDSATVGQISAAVSRPRQLFVEVGFNY